MVKKSHLKVKIRFSGAIIKEPFIYRLGHQFKVVTNIRRALIEEKNGWMDLELSGEMSDIEKAVGSLEKLGIKVDPIEGDVVE